MRGESFSMNNREVCLSRENDPMKSTGSSDNLKFLSSDDPVESLVVQDIGQDFDPVPLKKEYALFGEPTSVLDAHMAPSPASSLGSPESLGRTGSLFRQQSFSSNFDGSLSPSYSYSENRRSFNAKVALFQSNVENGMIPTAWEGCVGDGHHQIEILDCLLDDGEMSDSHTTTSNSHDLSFWQENMDQGNIDALSFLPELDSGMMADPLYQLLLNDNSAIEADPLSQMLNPQLKIFQESLQHHSQSEQQQSLTDVQMTVKHCLPHFEGLQQQDETVEPKRQPQEEEGLYLVQLLLGCAEAVERGDFQPASQMLSQVRDFATPLGEPIQRLAVYFGESLATYFHTNLTEVFGALPLDADVAYQAYLQVLPFARFAHLTANQAILEAVGSDERIHVVDLDIGQGLQWSPFIQALSVRRNACHLKITGVGTDQATLQKTGRRLCECAAEHRVTLEYHAVVEAHMENLDAAVLRVHLGESLAVNCANVLNRSLGSHRQGALERVLCMIKSLSPAVVALVEVESNNYLPSFQGRFVETLRHYSALFDCLEATLSRSSTERLQIEKFLFASTIKDILTKESRSQNMVRHVRMETWQMCFQEVGFKELPLSSYARSQAKYLLTPYNGEYKLAEGSALTLGWQDTPLVSVSAWTGSSY